MIKTYVIDLTIEQINHVDKILKAYMDMSYESLTPYKQIDAETASQLTAIIHFRNQIRNQ